MAGNAAHASLSEIDESLVDLQQYSKTYSGFTKLARLTFVAETFPKLKPLAYKLLLQELKNSSNPTMFLKVLQGVDESVRNELGCDENIAISMNQNNQARMEILESELSSAKSAVLKEAMRTGYNDIGHLHYQMGNLGEALKSYLRTRDVCTMPRHNCEMCLNVILVSIDLRQFFSVTNFIGKVTDTLGDDLIVAKLKAAAALVDMNDQHFKQAAWKFLELNPLLGNQFNNVVSAEDIAMYASICALATFDRAELRTKLVDNKAFVNTYMNLLPDVKALVMSFYGGQYGTAMKLLSALRPHLLCDMYLHSHVSALLDMIAERMLLQFFSAYCTVDLQTMAQNLQMDRAVLEQALVRLISSGKLAARIDAQAGTLHRRSQDVRRTTLEKVASLSKVHAAAIKRDILRLSLLQQGFAVGDAAAEDHAAGSGGGRTATPPAGSHGQGSQFGGMEEYGGSSAGNSSHAHAVPTYHQGGSADQHLNHQYQQQQYYQQQGGSDNEANDVDMEYYNYESTAAASHGVSNVSQLHSQASPSGTHLGDMEDGI